MSDGVLILYIGFIFWFYATYGIIKETYGISEFAIIKNWYYKTLDILENIRIIVNKIQKNK